MNSPLLDKYLANTFRTQEAPGKTVASHELVRLEHITKTYHLGAVDVPVLNGVSLIIERGEMVALMGASGSGKTTLMNILGCLDRPSSGQFWFDGREMSSLSPDERALVRTTKLGFVFQCFNLLPRTSAVQNVLMPLDYALRRPAGDDARRLAESLLAQVGLAARMDHDRSQMSGGQQQRVAIARALVNRPALLLADEPTGNLDSHTGDEILRMFQRLNAEGITVLLVTHDAKVAAYAHRTIRIADGQIEGGGANASPIQDGHAFLDPHVARASAASPPAINVNGSAKFRAGGTILRRHGADGYPAASATATVAKTAATSARPGQASLPRARANVRRPNSPRREIEPQPRRSRSRPLAPPHVSRSVRRSAAEQDAVGPYGPGRDHRRRGGHRHGGDRSGLQDRTPKNHR